MERFGQLLLKIATCMWFGTFWPLMMWVVCSINSGDMTRAAGIGLFALWGITGLVFGVFIKGENDK